MKIEEIKKILDLVFNTTDGDFISCEFYETKNVLDNNIGCLEVDLCQCYEDIPIITKNLYFNKDTRELISNYEKKIALKKEIEHLQKELEKLQ